MTFQYARLAIGVKPQWRNVVDIVPCDENGDELPRFSDREESVLYWAKKIIDYIVDDNVLYVRLEGVDKSRLTF